MMSEHATHGPPHFRCHDLGQVVQSSVPVAVVKVAFELEKGELSDLASRLLAGFPSCGFLWLLGTVTF